MSQASQSNIMPYPDYKDSGVPWLGGIPSHWEVKPLKYLISCNDESLPETTDDDFELFYIDISSVSLIDGILNKELMTFDKAPSRARRIVKSGDVVVSTVRTYLKAIAQITDAEDNLIVSTGFAVLRAKINVISEFLGYWIQSDLMVSQIVANSNGVSYPAINSTDLVRLPFVEFGKNEQQAIVNFLDKKLAHIDTLISKQQQLVDTLAEQRTAIISHAVTKGLDANATMKDSGVPWLGEVPEGWDIIKLKNITEFFKGFAFKSEDFSTENGLYLIKASNIKQHVITPVTTYISANKIQPAFYKVILQQGDIILSTVGSLPNVKNSAVGQIATVNKNYDGSLLNQNNVCFRANLFVNKRYLSWLVKASYFRAKLDFYSLWIANQAYLEVHNINDIECPLPEINEQQTIADYLDQETAKIDQMTLASKQMIDKLQEYRSALITQAVTGKIDVRHFDAIDVESSEQGI